MNTTHRTLVARRPLTDAELADIFAQIDAATTTVGTLAVTICAVYTALLAGVDRPDLGFGPGQHIDPTEFQIPETQRRAIVAVALNRTQEWGSTAGICVDFVTYLPGTYDDPAVAVPMPDLPDRRPPIHQLHVTREATDVIAANTRYLDQLADAYGHDSTVVRDAASSWHRELTGLLVNSAGGHTLVRADGHRSLLVATASGFSYGIVFHAEPRRCTVPGCLVPLNSDGTPTAPASTTVDSHEHRPSYPPGASEPGVWIAHS